MNRLNRYSFVAKNSNNNETSQPKQRTIAAVNFTSFAADAAASESIAEYLFNSFSDMLKNAKDETEKKYFADAIEFCKGIESLEIRVDILDNGQPYNRIIAKRKDGGSTKMRLYGSGKKIAVDEQTISGADLEKVVFGYCKSAGEFVTANGTAPVIYANVAALM